MKTAIITFLALAAAMAALAGETVRVANGPRPSQTIRNWHLKQEWRAGPEGENFLFGRIGDVAQDGSGNLYLLDFQQQETYVFDPAGKFLKTLGGRGEGPGETTLARDLLLRAGRTGLLNRFPAEIVWFDAQGDPAGTTVPHFADGREGFLGAWFARSRHGRLALGMTRSLFDGKIKSNQDFLAGCSLDGTIGPVYLDFGDADHRGSFEDVVDEGQIYDPLAERWDLDGQGRIWVAPQRNEYLLQVFTETGELALEVRRQFNCPRRQDSKKRKVRQSLARKWRKSGLTMTVDEYSPCIEKLWIMENPWGTEVWVETGASGHDLPQGVMVRYDLFNLEGEFTHQVDIVGNADPLFDQWHLVGDNRLIMVRNASSGGYEEDDPAHPRFEDAELEVISYRIIWEE